jgi:hypothetical protein
VVKVGRRALTRSASAERTADTAAIDPRSGNAASHRSVARSMSASSKLAVNPCYPTVEAPPVSVGQAEASHWFELRRLAAGLRPRSTPEGRGGLSQGPASPLTSSCPKRPSRYAARRAFYAGSGLAPAVGTILSSRFLPLGCNWRQSGGSRARAMAGVGRTAIVT